MEQGIVIVCVSARIVVVSLCVSIGCLHARHYCCVRAHALSLCVCTRVVTVCVHTCCCCVCAHALSLCVCMCALSFVLSLCMCVHIVVGCGCCLGVCVCSVELTTTCCCVCTASTMHCMVVCTCMVSWSSPADRVQCRQKTWCLRSQ
jgi:hypothetical protein